jgi:hypothetical protein
MLAAAPNTAGAPTAPAPTLGKRVALLPAVDMQLRSYTPPPEAELKFRFWHVEPLLNHAADLLDRCLAERAEYDALRAQAAVLTIDIETERERQAIVNERERAGQFNWMYDALSKEVNARRTEAALRQDAVNSLRNATREAKDGTAASWGYDANVRQQRAANYVFDGETEAKNIQWAFETREKGFRVKDRAMVETALCKREQLSQDLEALDFAGRAVRLTGRIQRDFEDAYDRMSTAAKGLKLLYGYESGIPSLSPASTTPTTLPIDVCVLWVREAIKFLLVFAQLDQAFSVTLSLKDILGTGKWDEVKRSSPRRVTFAVPRETFASHTFCRLRGISAFVHGPSLDSGPWGAVIRLPDNALSIQGIDNSGQQVNIPVPQQDLSDCYLTRIETRSSPRAPDVAGLISLLNASPIAGTGESWHVTIVPPAGDTSLFQELSDLAIELNLIGRPKART